ncbi:glycogen synthase GlgA [Salinisphaera hydrothermalis]|uniref:glycogen synthase GlgA n=1 Tax=Salinisphaera hydrothermalis TaxID=563188 RepID=UPI00333EAB51
MTPDDHPVRRHRILFVASEAVPWIKTGGLADVAGSLPRALAAAGHDVRLLIPAYGDVLAQYAELTAVPGFRPPFAGIRLLTTRPDSSGLRSWFVDLPGVGDRRGNPYHDEHINDWPDNAHRFGVFARAAAALAGGRAGLDWQADILHCNDWQTGLVPVHAMLERVPATTIFTIHNLQYRGLFAAETRARLDLPAWLWHPDALEFHGQLSFIKGGLAFADALTTVSPTYAREICTPHAGHGLDGLLRARGECLSGVLNGLDPDVWNPADDPHLPACFDAEDLRGKRRCKKALQHELGLAQRAEAPLCGVISRLVAQKGIDLILAGLPRLLERGGQLALLGRGDPAIEARLRAIAAEHPAAVAVRLEFDEGLAHRIEAGADLFLMPSRFEPCGLNQMYSQRYGTPPLVHRCGGLADSVVDTDTDTLEDQRATGFVFEPATEGAFIEALERALAYFAQPDVWRRIQRAGMARDFSWRASASRYLEIYAQAARSRGIEGMPRD